MLVLKGAVLIEIPEFYPTPDTAQTTSITEREVASILVANEFRVIEKSQALWANTFSLDDQDDIDAASALAYKSSAQHLLLGRAFQTGPSQKVSTGRVELFVVGVKLEVKLIGAYNGEVIFAEASYGKSADTNEGLARQKAFQSAASSLSERLTTIVGFSGCEGVTSSGHLINVTLKLPASGVSVREVAALREELLQVSGIKEVILQEFNPYLQVDLEVVYSGDARSLADAIQAKTLAGRRLSVAWVGGGSLILHVE